MNMKNLREHLRDKICILRNSSARQIIKLTDESKNRKVVEEYKYNIEILPLKITEITGVQEQVNNKRKQVYNDTTTIVK